MPYPIRPCPECGCQYRPHAQTKGRPHCWPCELRMRAEAKDAAAANLPASRLCEVCQRAFTPSVSRPSALRCLSCDRAGSRKAENPYSGWQPGQPVPKAPTHLSAPLRQAVFDLETFSLDRGWGVLMVGSIMVYGDGEPKSFTFDLRDTEAWKRGERSNDSELGAQILRVLSDCHILIAHNGLRFDIPYLNSVALKYGMPRINAKLVDPVQVARQKYRIGSNSLASLAAFLELPEEKMPVGADVWRKALFDANEDCWLMLRERCESDVRLLAMVAGKVMGDVGMIDNKGSAFR